MPVHVIKVPCTDASLAPHLAHNSRKLSLASNISAAIVAPSQPGIMSQMTPTHCSSLLANWNEKKTYLWTELFRLHMSTLN